MDLAHAPTQIVPAPADSEGSRAYQQQRIALLARVEIVLSLLIQSVVTFVYFAAPGRDLATGSDWAVIAHPVVIVSLVGLWLRARGRQRQPLELAILEFACLIVPLGFAFVALWSAPASVRPGFILVMTTTDLLILRSVLVPGSGRRAVVLGAVFTVLVAVWSAAHHLEHAPGDVATAVVTAALMAMWCIMAGVIISGVAARTIFGLRRMVRQALQVGQYTLLRKIGEGGMGVVWEARHALLRRRTAVKLLPAERAGEEAILRFEREVQLSSALTHPNTIAIYDYGRTADGVFYYAMEYLDGIDLQALVERDGPQSPGLVVHVLCQVADALAEAHGVGLIHRDIKPANVILCERGGQPLVAKVLDFGLVKHVHGSSELSLSRTDAMLGTPLYISPEILLAPDRIDGRSDLYALGAVGYFLLTGHPPFEGGAVVEIMGHHLHTPPVPPSKKLGAPIPEDLEALILECLAKDPAARPPSAAALSARLAATSPRSTWTPEVAAAAWDRYRTSAAPGPTTLADAPRLTVALR